MKTLLTVDWDYFVEEKAEYDLGHSESLAFLDMIWRSRAGLLDHISTNGAEKGFWRRIEASGHKPGITYVSDSHAHAYGLLRGIDHVILVDAHHDCWETDSLGLDKQAKGVYCHNWLRVWLQKGKNRRVTWVVPDWSKGRFSLPKDMRDRVTVTSKVKPWPVDRVHVCRSGCWTPPWLDKQFIEFVKDRGCGTVRLQEGAWDALQERWTDEDLREIRGQEATVQEALRSIKVGTMLSSDFIGARVEVAVSA